MPNYQRILKDCFWDLNFTEDKIKEIINGDDFRRKMFLFDKILLNSTSLFEDLSIFDIACLRKLLDKYKISEFNKDYIFRRKNLVEVFFFNKPLLIDDLKWQI